MRTSSRTIAVLLLLTLSIAGSAIAGTGHCDTWAWRSCAMACDQGSNNCNLHIVPGLDTQVHCEEEQALCYDLCDSRAGNCAAYSRQLGRRVPHSRDRVPPQR